MEPLNETPSPLPSPRSRWIAVAVALQIITLAVLVFVFISSQKPMPPKEAPSPALPRDDKEIMSLQNTIDALNARLITLEQKPSEPSPAQDIETLHHSITSLEEQIAAQSGQQSVLVQQLLAFDQLEAAVIQGRPYSSAFEALVASGVSEPELKVLKSHQYKGIASTDDLKREFDTALESYFHPKAATHQSVWQRVSSLVTIRKVGETHTGDDAQSVIARAESAMNDHKLDAAMEEIRSLSESNQATFSEWLKRASAHQQTMQAIALIKQSLSAAVEHPHD